MKLYEITKEYDKLMAVIAENEGVVGEHLAASLAVVKEEFNEKAINIAKAIKNLEGEEKGFKEEGQRLQAKAKTLQGNIKWLKDYLKDEMSQMGINDVKGEVLTIRIRPSQPSCIVLDDKIIPADYMRVIPETKEPDKKAIIAHYKEKKEIVPGTEISVGTTLTIR